MTEWSAAAELRKPLDRKHVKTREQGRSQVSYIAGWHAIDEANRIFGFDGWTRETVELRMVAEGERIIGKPPFEKPGWGVTYIARVRVKVAISAGEFIVREGAGAGHGIDADLGQAHESALKEAETDAMKRALMTFGHPFGLALYDKTQANVEDAGQVAARAAAEKHAHQCVEAANKARSVTTLGDWLAAWASIKKHEPQIADDYDVKKAWAEVWKELNNPDQKVAAE